MRFLLPGRSLQRGSEVTVLTGRVELSIAVCQKLYCQSYF